MSRRGLALPITRVLEYAALCLMFITGTYQYSSLGNQLMVDNFRIKGLAACVKHVVHGDIILSNDWPEGGYRVKGGEHSVELIDIILEDYRSKFTPIQPTELLPKNSSPRLHSIAGLKYVLLCAQRRYIAEIFSQLEALKDPYTLFLNLGTHEGANIVLAASLVGKCRSESLYDHLTDKTKNLIEMELMEHNFESMHSTTGNPSTSKNPFSLFRGKKHKNKPEEKPEMEFESKRKYGVSSALIAAILRDLE